MARPKNGTAVGCSSSSMIRRLRDKRIKKSRGTGGSHDWSHCSSGLHHAQEVGEGRALLPSHLQPCRPVGDVVGELRTEDVEDCRHGDNLPILQHPRAILVADGSPLTTPALMGEYV